MFYQRKNFRRKKPNCSPRKIREFDRFKNRKISLGSKNYYGDKKMVTIVTTKIYSVSSNQIKIYISEHDDGAFYGHVVYFKKINHSSDPSFDVDIDLKGFIASGEDMVYQSCIDWVEENISKEAEFKLQEVRS